MNEIFVCATFSGQLGWWNERLASNQGFVTALTHPVRANVLAEEAILRVQPLALFIQSESTEYFHPEHPDAQKHAEFLNQMRFPSLDLCYGYDVHASAYEYLMDNGLSREEPREHRVHGGYLHRHSDTLVRSVGSRIRVAPEWRHRLTCAGKHGVVAPKAPPLVAMAQ